MADSINSKAKEYYDNDDSGGSLNNNLKDFLKQQGATGNSINTLWRSYAYGEGGNSLNTRLGKLWGTSGSLMKRWQDVLGLTWDEVKAFFNFRDTDPDFLLDGSTSFDGSNDYISIADVDNLSFGDGTTDSAFSISGWIKTGDTNNFPIFSKGVYPSTGEIRFVASGNGITLYLYSGSTYEYGSHNSAMSNTLNKWTHVTATYDGRGGTSANAGIKLYVNGVYYAPNDKGGAGSYTALVNTSAVAYIARYNTNYAKGHIVNVGIWSRALSASEVESIQWRGSHSELKDTELTNLVSWYDLQGDVLDKQGSNNGTNNGATLNSDSYSGESPFKPRIQDKANPKFSKALSDGSTDFDGSNDYIAGMANNPSGNFTISAWINPDSISDGAIYSGNAFELLLRPDSNKLKMHVGGAGTTEVTTADLTVGVWQHVCGTWDGSNAKLYVNGSLEPSSTNGTLSNPSSGTTQIGKNSLVSQNYYNGKMANVAIHSSALTQSQIQELMFTEKYSGLTSDLKTNLVSWYDLGSTSESIVKQDDMSADNDSNWTSSSGSVTFDTDHYEIVGNSTKHYLTSTTYKAGASYKISYDIKNGTASGVGVEPYSQDGSSEIFGIQTVTTSEYVTVTSTFVNGSATSSGRVGVRIGNTGGNNIEIKNFKLEQLQAPDSKGSNTGEIYGATTTTGYTSSPHGVVDPLNYGEVYSGRALNFDGSNDYVNIPDDNSLSFGDSSNDSAFSISAWVKMDDATSFTVASKGLYNSTAEWKLGLGSDDKLILIIYDESVANTYEYGLHNTALTSYENQWVHLTGTYDGRGGTSATDGISLYVNGSSVTVTAGGNGTYVAMENLGADVHICREASAYSNGLINNLKIFSAELTQAQIQQLFTAPETVLPTGVSASNLKLDLPMQEGAGSYIYDGSGNQNHGTISGATWATGQQYGYQSSLVRSNTPMVFDGSDDAVAVDGAIASMRTTTGTWSTWINNPDITSAESYFLSAGDTNANEFIILIKDADGDLRAFLRDAGSDRWEVKTDSPAFTNNTWHHVVITHNGTEPELYVDGSKPAQTFSVSTDKADWIADCTGIDNFRIGHLYKSSSAGGSFSGIMNEVAVWDTNLDADAVTQLYNSGVPLDPTSDSGNYDNSDDLQGYWRNDGITTWTDRANTGVASFDGTDDYLDTGSDHFDETVWSASVWISHYVSDSLDFLLGGSHGVSCLLLNSGGNIAIRDSGADYRSFGSNNTLKDGNWHHLVFVSDGTDIVLYTDGSLTSTASPQPTTTRFMLRWIGSGYPGNSFPVECQLSGTHVFDVALSASEVTELYNIDKRSSISGHSKFSNCKGSWLMGAGTGDTASTIQDQTSNNNDGTVNGASLVGYNNGTASGSPVSIVIPEGSTSGRDNQGFLLSDTTSISNGMRLHGSEYISIQDSEVLSFGDGTDDKPFSIEAWVKMDDATDFQIAGKGIYNSTGEWLFQNINDTLGLYLFDESVASTYELATYNTALTSYEGQWIHVACTYDGRGGTSANAGIKLYLNGSSVATTLGGAGTYVSMENLGANVHIGRYDSTYSKGLIDEVRIYSKELSASEILKNYNNSLSKHS